MYSPPLGPSISHDPHHYSYVNRSQELFDLPSLERDDDHLYSFEKLILAPIVEEKVGCHQCKQTHPISVTLYCSGIIPKNLNGKRRRTRQPCQKKVCMNCSLKNMKNPQIPSLSYWNPLLAGVKPDQQSLDFCFCCAACFDVCPCIACRRSRGESN